MGLRGLQVRYSVRCVASARLLSQIKWITNKSNRMQRSSYEKKSDDYQKSCLVVRVYDHKSLAQSSDASQARHISIS